MQSLEQNPNLKALEEARTTGELVGINPYLIIALLDGQFIRDPHHRILTAKSYVKMLRLLDETFTRTRPISPAILEAKVATSALVRQQVQARVLHLASTNPASADNLEHLARIMENYSVSAQAFMGPINTSLPQHAQKPGLILKIT